MIDDLCIILKVLDYFLGNTGDSMFHERHTHRHTLLDVTAAQWGRRVRAKAITLLEGDERAFGFGCYSVLHLLDRPL